MKQNRRSLIREALVGGFAAAACFATPYPANAQSLSPAEARQIAEDAYIYGYSLITTEVTRVQGANVSKADPEKLSAPMNQFANVPRYPPADYRGVSAPNADTLYSLAWLDLSEPHVFSHPEMGNRFYLFEMVDLWMHDLESSPSMRTAGGKAANYLITGPGWNGTVPARDEAHPDRDPLHGHSRPHLRRRHRAGLQSRQRAAGAVQDHAALCLGQAVHSGGAAGEPEPGLQHDRQAAGGHSRHGNGWLFQPHGKANGRRRTAGGGRCADARQHGQDRHRARKAVRDEQARRRPCKLRCRIFRRAP